MTTERADHDRLRGGADAVGDADEAFIGEVTALLTPMGMPPIAGRMHGYLLLASEPATLDAMVDGLGISKSSASVAARLLERHGVIRRFAEPGTKRIRYGISGRCDGFLIEQVRFLGAMGALLEHRAAAHPDDASSPRLEELGGFFLRLRDGMNRVLGGQGYTQSR
jgi:hypothetical protein